MRITRVESIPVRVPLKPGMLARTAHGLHHTSDYVIVRVYTDQGLVGVGEATVSALWSGETSVGAKGAIDGLLGPALVGRDPTAITEARRVMDFLIKQNPFTKAAVEMALWDLTGKAWGRPVYDLLGGKLRDVIATKMMIGAFDLDQVREMAARFLSAGARCLKVKVGLDRAGDVRRVQAVREVAGDEIPITIDANCGWDWPTARRALDDLRGLNLLAIEQPIAAGDPEALARLRMVAGAPLIADESVFTLTDAWSVLKAQAADVISIYPGKNGGIAASLEIAHLARSVGLPCHLGSNLELGVGSAAMAHLAAATPNLDSDAYPADLIGPHYHVADLLSTPLELSYAHARVPEGPGLGVEIDEDALRRFRVD